MLWFPRAAFFSISGILYYLACRRAIRELLQRGPIDLLHAHTILPDGFGALLLARKFDLPLVCTLHGSDVKLYPKQSMATAAATRWALRRIDHLIAVSHDVGRTADTLGATHAPAVIHNGADGRSFSSCPRDAARMQLRLPAHRKIVLFVGNLVEVKGPNLLMQAMKAVDALLVIVGDGPLRPELQRQSLRDRVDTHFAGWRPHDEIALWLNAADCLALPSLSEGFPTLLPEAMLCRTFVIATSVGGTPEIVSDGETGLLVPPSDIAALTTAIRSAISMSPEQRDPILDRAQQMASQSLTWRANARATSEMYEVALASCRSGALSATNTGLHGASPSRDADRPRGVTL
jgi:glycosyltransferase involved in cell wall biosynthesis